MIPFVLLLQAAAIPPVAGDRPPATMVVEPVAMAIAAFDADGDARITMAEVTQGVQRSFTETDRAGAGSLGYIAFADWAERWLGDRNAVPSPFETDRDADNRITEAELQAQFARLFARFDRDKDGVLTRAELLTLRPVAQDRRDRQR